MLRLPNNPYANTCIIESDNRSVLNSINKFNKKVYFEKLPVYRINLGFIEKGILAGQPAIFVNLSGDTHGFTKDRYVNKKNSWYLDQYTLLEKIFSVTKISIDNAPRKIVIQGGDPLHYENALAAIAFQLKHEGFQVILNTPGRILDKFVFGYFDFVYLTLPREYTRSSYLETLRNIWENTNMQISAPVESVECLENLSEHLYWLVKNKSYPLMLDVKRDCMYKEILNWCKQYTVSVTPR